MPGIPKVAMDHLVPANPSSSPSRWGSPRGGDSSWRGFLVEGTWAALPSPGEENHPQPKGSPCALPVGLVGSSELGPAAWLANSEVLAAMETCTSPSLWLKSQTKPQNKRRRVSLFVQLQKPWWEGKEGPSGSRHPRSRSSCSSYLSSSLGLCLALIQPNDGRKRWLWDGNVQIFWVRTMRKIILIASFDWRFLKVCSAFCLCSLGPIIFSCLCPIVIFPFWKWKRQKS